MGIDFSYCDANWSYSGFHRFRTRIANACGLLGNLAEHFENGYYIQLKDHAIFPLINHSDCDGELTVDEMKSVVPVLEDVIRRWPEDDYDKIQCLKLIEGMKIAIKKRKSLKFM